MFIIIASWKGVQSSISIAVFVLGMNILSLFCFDVLALLDVGFNFAQSQFIFNHLHSLVLSDDENWMDVVHVTTFLRGDSSSREIFLDRSGLGNF